MSLNEQQEIVERAKHTLASRYIMCVHVRIGDVQELQSARLNAVKASLTRALRYPQGLVKCIERGKVTSELLIYIKAVHCLRTT